MSETDKIDIPFHFCIVYVEEQGVVFINPETYIKASYDHLDLR